MASLHITGPMLRGNDAAECNLTVLKTLRRRTVLRRLVGLLAPLMAAGLMGCQQPEGPARPVAKTAADPLTPAEIELFLAMVQAHPRRKAPEFTNEGDDRPIDDALLPRNMVIAFHERFQRLFDPQAQGAVLAAQGDWAKLLTKYKVAPSEFAALVTRVSCAVTRLQLDGRFRFADLVSKADARIEDLVARIEKYDAVPATQLTSDISRQRTQAIIQLGQTTALLEFSRLLSSVPPESLSNVATRLSDLTPLLPSEQSETAFEELDRFGKSPAIGQQAPAPRS